METQKAEKTFRNYRSPDVKEAVKEHYRKMRERQTVEYVGRMRNKYLTYDRPMHLWDAMTRLNELVDVSDPDMDLPNVQHLIQSAEAIRRDNRPDWMQLVGLIHDLGKIMFVWGSDQDGTSDKEQWGLVGDVFIVGCKLPETCVYPEFNRFNPDMKDDRYNSDLGIYEAHCGIDNTLVAWGHDEYLYQVLKRHPENRIPEPGMVMIRYHSFYPWHTGGSYGIFEKDSDQKYREWVLDFNKYDLYTKSDKIYDLDEIKSYYAPIAEKYLGSGPIYF